MLKQKASQGSRKAKTVLKILKCTKKLWTRGKKEKGSLISYYNLITFCTNATQANIQSTKKKRTGIQQVPAFQKYSTKSEYAACSLLCPPWLNWSADQRVTRIPTPSIRASNTPPANTIHLVITGVIHCIISNRDATKIQAKRHKRGPVSWPIFYFIYF